MTGPRPDPDTTSVGSRKWRVSMKSGETWVIAAERLDPIQSLGLSFDVAGIVVAVVPFGTFNCCEEIDPATEETPHIRKLPASEVVTASETSRPETRNKREEKQIRRLVEYSKEHPGDIPLLLMCFPKGEWVALKEPRQRFLKMMGGFPPNTYKLFNEAVEQAEAAGLVETAGED